MDPVNERYAAYATAHGETPEDMIKVDKVRWPGAMMCGYVLWINKNLEEFKKVSPRSFVCDGLVNHDSFTQFLKDKAEVKT